MNNESIVGPLIMVLCCWGCAALFTGIAIHARKRSTPIHFWASSKIDPASVRDVAGYNRENSVMWLAYSVPYWLSGGISLFLGKGDHVAFFAVALLVFACFPGIWILVKQYRKIEKKYINREKT